MNINIPMEVGNPVIVLRKSGNAYKPFLEPFGTDLVQAYLDGFVFNSIYTAYSRMQVLNKDLIFRTEEIPKAQAELKEFVDKTLNSKE